MGNKFRFYAYAHARDVKVINIFSIADFRTELSEKTGTNDGAVTGLKNIFEAMNKDDRRAPFNFTWKPDKHIPASFFTSLKRGEDFTLELRIRIVDDSNSVKFGTNWNFYQCQYQKSSRRSGGMYKVDASYGLFRPSE